MKYDAEFLDILESSTGFKFEISRGDVICKESEIPLSDEIISYIPSEVFYLPNFQQSTFCGMASYNHTQLIRQLDGILWQQLRQSEFAHYVESLKVKSVFFGSIRIPDIVITIENQERISEKWSEIENPHTIFEILSPTTEKIDRNQKLEEYQNIDSLQEYVMIAQNEYKIEQYLRQGKTKWIVKIYDSLDDTCILTIGVKIQMSELYQKIKF